MKRTILCVGEVLWDVFPDGQYLGGAPLNVAYHLHALGRPVRIASRIGDDPLGQLTRQRLAEIDLDDVLVQTDPVLMTGRVHVELLDPLTPRYDIKRPAAWDAIEPVPALLQAAGESQAIVFGSLAQRSERSRQTIATLLAEGDALRVFDINLRPPFVDRELIGISLQMTDFLKLNEIELGILRDWYILPADDLGAVEALTQRFGCQSVCVTRGAEGALLWHEGRWHEHGGYAVTAVDPVGAGDAFLAGLLDGLLDGIAGDQALAAACALGAYVATQPSSTPRLDHQAIGSIRNAAVAV